MNFDKIIGAINNFPLSVSYQKMIVINKVIYFSYRRNGLSACVLCKYERKGEYQGQ